MPLAILLPLCSAKAPPPPPLVAGLSYTLVRGNFTAFPSHTALRRVGRQALHGSEGCAAQACHLSVSVFDCHPQGCQLCQGCLLPVSALPHTPASCPWSRVLERGKLTRLGLGYACNPLLPPSVSQACVSAKYRTLFAIRAAGRLRVAAKDVKGGKMVQLLLGASGTARVTVTTNGSVVSSISITGGLASAYWVGLQGAS